MSKNVNTPVEKNRHAVKENIIKATYGKASVVLRWMGATRSSFQTKIANSS